MHAPSLFAITLSGCCGGAAPQWQPLEEDGLEGSTTSVALTDAVTARGQPTLSVQTDGDVLAEVVDGQLTLTPQPGWVGTSELTLVAEDRCGKRSTTKLAVHSGSGPTDASSTCVVDLSFDDGRDLLGVAVAGSFNDWSTEQDPMELQDGVWRRQLQLPPGAYPYKLVAFDDFGQPLWTCDPSADTIHCDDGYIEPAQTDFQHTCALGAPSCNSLLVVQPCDRPQLSVSELHIDRATGSVQIEVTATGTPVDTASATLDDVPLQAFDGKGFTVDVQGLTAGRHTFRFRAADAGGRAAKEVYIPVWIDDWEWQDGVMYFAFVDRMLPGDDEVPPGEGASALTGDYLGGDLRGLLRLLPYLDDLGVDILWLSNMQDNAEGDWAGQCGQTFAGYHAYWPDDSTAVEERFGTAAELQQLVDAAHRRGMRVVMDWVANHVHQDHPYVQERSGWFHPFADCNEVIDGQLGFDRIPQRCWFAPYLPDIDHSQPDALVAVVRDAMAWARTYELDGLRVDAAKHMSHAVVWNLTQVAEQQIEHPAAGGDETFWTIGETFDGRERIASYLGDDMLMGQFDFPLYNRVRDVFVRDAGELNDLLVDLDTSKATFGSSTMSPFLGNHDVVRFVTEAAQGDLGACDGEGIRVAEVPEGSEPTDRLKLAWTFLFTIPGTPLVYYGDELGLPGHADPDNRQPLWWHVPDLQGVDSVDAMASRVDDRAASVVRHVAALARARKAHPALRRGVRTEWWREPNLLAYARSDGDDHAIVVLNRGEGSRQLVNGLAFAGLPQGTYEDVLTGAVVESVGDELTVDVGPRGSVVLVWRG
ncbi:MAG: alpha amylase C-terminal domain-containing protein [Myxococcales bacterium]|nr:alpha amylase C-terminal domain-containing protein [Myxococcales bacterium]